MTINYNPGVVTSGLVLCLDAGNPRSYPGTGTTWFDVSSNLPTTLQNSPTYTSGINGYFTLNGTNSWVDIGTNASFMPANFTASIWFYLNGTPSAGTVYRVFRSRTYGFGVNVTESRGFDAFMYDSTLALSSISGSSTLSLSTWYNIAITFASNTFSIYLNGSLVTSTNTASNTAYYINGYMGLGRDADSANSFLNGRIANYCFYNKGLTATEVLQNFNAIRGRYGI
jgi:hypothetical protein